MDALDVWRGRGTSPSEGCSGTVETKRVLGLPGGKNGGTRDTIGTRWAKKGKQRRFYRPPLSFMETTQSPSPQSYIDGSLILSAYPIALSKDVFLARTSLSCMASSDLAWMRGQDGDPDDDRVRTLILGDLGDRVDGTRGNDEYLFEFVNTPLGGDGGSSSGGAISLMLG